MISMLFLLIYATTLRAQGYPAAVGLAAPEGRPVGRLVRGGQRAGRAEGEGGGGVGRVGPVPVRRVEPDQPVIQLIEIGRASCRERV